MSDNQPKDDIDHSEDEVIESQDEGQKEFKASTTVHHAEAPEEGSVSDPATYSQQDRLAPQPNLEQEVEPQSPDGDGEKSDNDKE